MQVTSLHFINLDGKAVWMWSDSDYSRCLAKRQVCTGCQCCTLKVIHPSYKHGIYTEHKIFITWSLYKVNCSFETVPRIWLPLPPTPLPMPFHIQCSGRQSQNSKYTTVTIIWVDTTIAPVNPESLQSQWGLWFVDILKHNRNRLCSFSEPCVFILI